MSHQVHGICIILVYVDDLLIVSDSLEWITSAKRAIGEQFRMTDFGEAKFILGMDIVRNREASNIILSQEQYTKEILEKYGMLDGMLEISHGSHALPRWRGSIRPRQRGHVTTGTRDFPCHPRVIELSLHVYKTGHCICGEHHQRTANRSGPRNCT
jgi:hypothetical protein